MQYERRISDLCSELLVSLIYMRTKAYNLTKQNCPTSSVAYGTKLPLNTLIG
jgi:hypothetical protein